MMSGANNMYDPCVMIINMIIFGRGRRATRVLSGELEIYGLREEVIDDR